MDSFEAADTNDSTVNQTFIAPDTTGVAAGNTNMAMAGSLSSRDQKDNYDRGNRYNNKDNKNRDSHRQDNRDRPFVKKVNPKSEKFDPRNQKFPLSQSKDNSGVQLNEKDKFRDQIRGNNYTSMAATAFLLRNESDTHLYQTLCLFTAGNGYGVFGNMSTGGYGGWAGGPVPMTGPMTGPITVPMPYPPYNMPPTGYPAMPGYLYGAAGAYGGAGFNLPFGMGSQLQQLPYGAPAESPYDQKPPPPPPLTAATNNSNVSARIQRLVNRPTPDPAV